MLPDPADICLERRRKMICACLKPCRIIEEYEVQPAERFGRRPVIDATADNWCKALVERCSDRDLLQGYCGGDRVRRKNEYDSVGARNQVLGLLRSFLDGVPFGAIH